MIFEYFQVEVADAENQDKSRRRHIFSRKKGVHVHGAVARNLHTGQFSL